MNIRGHEENFLTAGAEPPNTYSDIMTHDNTKFNHSQ